VRAAEKTLYRHTFSTPTACLRQQSVLMIVAYTCSPSKPDINLKRAEEIQFQK
jgi:hypothetical protein